jgi:hypothetical protein
LGKAFIRGGGGGGLILSAKFGAEMLFLAFNYKVFFFCPYLYLFYSERKGVEGLF